MRRIIFLICFALAQAFPVSEMLAQSAEKHTISGYIRESGSQETLPGVTVYLPALKTGTATNAYGFYSLTLEASDYELLFTYVGYEAQKVTLTLDKDIDLDISLQTASHQLESVEINAERQEKVSDRAQMSIVSVPAKQIKDIPAFLGEKDVLKVLQLMPGVQSGQEGSSGIYVRGGGPDQNLLILDDAPVYNASHLFGFFSVFNGDALKSVEMYKGGFPARFGGRLSSVIKMDMKEGHKEEFHGKGSIGLISSSMVLEGPILKNKASFLLSGRRTYVDVLARPFMPEDDKVGYYFYDLNAKVNYDFNKNNKLYLSGYFGDDKFGYKNTGYKYEADQFGNYTKTDEVSSISRAGLSWGNATGTLRWNHLFNNKLFSNTSLIYSNYNFNTYVKEDRFDPDEAVALNYDSGIRDLTLKFDMDYMPNPKHHIRAGIQSTLHRFTPSALTMKAENSEDLNINLEKEQQYHTIESGIYIEDNWKATDRLMIEGGIRLSHFKHENKSYVNPEPRLSAAYQIGPDLSAKASFASMNQYIHMLSNSGISLPTDLWVSSTDRVAPQKSWQVAGGLAKDLEEYNLAITLEGYYKKSDNVISYKEGASFLMLENLDNAEPIQWEDNITTGQAESYGTELLVQRKFGKLTGWVGYTLSWTQMQFDDLNFGEPFWAKYDRRHDISIVSIYKPKPSITLSAAWVYGTGNALTLPTSEIRVVDHYPQTDIPIQNNGYYNWRQSQKAYKERGNFRAAPYHRLDFGIQFHKKKKRGTRTWEISVYNVYNQANPFFYTTESDYNPQTEKVTKKLMKVTLIPILPSFSYRFEF